MELQIAANPTKNDLIVFRFVVLQMRMHISLFAVWPTDLRCFCLFVVLGFFFVCFFLFLLLLLLLLLFLFCFVFCFFFVLCLSFLSVFTICLRTAKVFFLVFFGFCSVFFYFFIFFCLKLPQCLYYMSAYSKGSGESACMHRFAWAFAGHLCDK